MKLFKPYVGWKAIYNAVRVLLGNQLAEGEQVKLFEYEFEKRFQKNNCVAVNSGTSALELAYDLADIQKGDEVITPVLTCTATNLPLARRGAKIIFADIGRNFNIDPEDVRRKITKKTKAIVFVHFGGSNSGLKEILELGRKHKIKVIEDAAQAVGSDFWGQADFTAVSFQAIKIITCGDGGMLLCKNKKDYEKARRLRWFGIDRPLKQKLGDVDVWEAGYKFHLNDIAAAIGRGNLANVDKLIAHRKKLIKIYEENLPSRDDAFVLGFHLWTGINFCMGICRDRKGLMEYLKNNGVETGIHHYRNDKYSVFGGKRLNLPNMNELENKYFILPLHQGISQRDVKKICVLINAYL